MSGPTRLKKSLGQHFLVDPAIVKLLLTAIEPDPPALLEIGPGGGALTESLLTTGRPLTLIELDRVWVEHWRAVPHPPIVIAADAADAEWLNALPSGQEFGVVGNLPYNAATAILRRLLTDHSRFPWLVLMFQREVAERLEHPGTRVGGPMGLLAQSVYHVQAIADVPPDAFRPPPKVWSRVLRFTHRPDALTPERIPGAWRVLQALFRRRRARLDRAVQHWTGKSRDVVQSWFSAAKIRPDARPDHMSLDGFRVLLDYVEGRRS